MWCWLYIDGLVNKLEKSWIGCYVENTFMDGISTPNYQGLNKLIYIYEQYAADFDIKFNGVKQYTYRI